MKGSRLVKQTIILPNSVVTRGRLIPAKQIWGGNPVKYIRGVKGSETFGRYAFTHEIII